MGSANKTIGIVGGGQLGRMLSLAAKPLGFDVVVVEAAKNSPAAQVGAKQIMGELYDAKALRKLAREVDVITVEIEHFDTAALEVIEAEGTPVHPRPKTVKLIQDKFKQKEFLEKAGVPLADFVKVDTARQAKRALKAFGGKMMLKSRTGAYDGRGNIRVEGEEELKLALKEFSGKPLYAERLINFERELAVMVARNVYGDMSLYPVTETIHERNICLETITPAQVSEDIKKKAESAAKKAVSLLEGAGMFGVEMFVDTKGRVMINEIAPRVHNSGHYSMDACVTGQFEQHIRAVSGLPLGDTALVKPAASMINILGERNGETRIQGLSEVLKHDGTYVHVYGKSPTKIDRKMGHINVIGDTVEATRETARKAREKLDI